MVYAYMWYICLCMETRDWYLVSILYWDSFYFRDRVFHWTEAHASGRLTGHQVPRSHLYWPPGTGVISTHHCAPLLSGFWGCECKLSRSCIDTLPLSPSPSLDQFIPADCFICYFTVFHFVQFLRRSQFCFFIGTYLFTWYWVTLCRSIESTLSNPAPLLFLLPLAPFLPYLAPIFTLSVHIWFYVLI